MNSNNINYQRRCAVNKAWINERQQIMNSRGSRNWTQKEQREILATGKCHGYEGQHMLSVKKHPEHAADENNIQLLTRKEHFQAHGGNWKNDANGRYNLKTGKIEPFVDDIPNIKYKNLSAPLSEHSKMIIDKQYKKLNAIQESTIKISNKKSYFKDWLPVHKSKCDSSYKNESTRNFFNHKATSSGVFFKTAKGNHPVSNKYAESKSNGQGIS